MIRFHLGPLTWDVAPRRGRTLLELAEQAGAPLRHACGRGDCGTCLVAVRGEGLEPPDPEEQALLAHLGARPAERLACRARLVEAAATLKIAVIP